MNNWLKRNSPIDWKWYHWLVGYFLCFASCTAVFFVQHLFFGYPYHIADANYGAAGGAIGMAGRNEWMRRKLSPRRQRRRKIEKGKRR